MTVTFTIIGKPVPQERRVHVRGGWAYDPPKSRKAKKIVRQYAVLAMPNTVASDRSFVVDLAFYGPHWGADVDNLAKLVMDAIKGVFWIDDHQVVEMRCKKVRCTKGQEKTVVEIKELVPEALQ